MSIRRTSRVLVSLAALAAMLGVTPGVRAENGINAVGTLERFPQEAFDAFGSDIRPEEPLAWMAEQIGGTLVPVPGAGQLWQVYPSSPAAPPRTGILVRDARNLKVVGSFVIPDRLERATVSTNYGGEWLHTTDGGNRVFLISEGNRQVLEVDASTFRVVMRPLPSDALPLLTVPLALAGMTYDHVTDSVLFLYGVLPNTSALNHVTVLQQLDLATGSVTNRIVRSCTGSLPATDVWGDTYATAPLADEDAVYVPCQQGVLPLFVQLPTAAVVRIPRASLFDPTGEESSVAAGGPMNTALLDPASGRITIFGYFGTMTVVDARSMTAVGSFETTRGTMNQSLVGAGLDPLTGRVLFQSQLGVGYVDARGAAPFVPTVAASAAAPGRERIVTTANRVYVLPGSTYPGSTMAKPDRYTVYNIAS